MNKSFYKIGLNTAIQTIGKGISIVLSFLNVALLTRFLGQEGFGNFTLTFAYLSFFGIFADLGLQLTMVRDFSQKGLLQKVYGTFFWLKTFLVFMATFFAIIFLLFFPYSSFLKIGIIIASLGITIGLLNNYATVIFQAKTRLDLVALVDVLVKITTTFFIGLFIFLRLGFYSILNTVLIGNLAGSFLIIFLLKKYVSFKFKFNFNLAKKMFFKSLPIGATVILSMLYFKIDILLLSLLKSSAEVGIYGLAYKIIENLLIFWGFYMATAYPLLSGFFARKKLNDIRTVWNKSILMAVGSAGIIIVFGFILAPILIRALGGEEFKASVNVLRILLFSLPLFFINNLFYHLCLIKEKTNLLLKAIGSSLLINVILNLIFIPKFGYTAAAINLLISETCLLLFYFPSGRKLIPKEA